MASRTIDSNTLEVGEVQLIYLRLLMHPRDARLWIGKMMEDLRLAGKFVIIMDSRSGRLGLRRIMATGGM